MDNATLLKVLEACNADYLRVKQEYGDSESAAYDLWGIDQVREIIGKMLKDEDTSTSLVGPPS